MRILFGTFLAAICFYLGCSTTPSSKNSAATSNHEPSANTVAPKPDFELQKQIAEIANEANGKVGVYAVLIETGETVSLNADERFAMQSVVKLPISMAVLKLVEEEKLKLDQNVTIAKDELVPSNMRSLIRDDDPNGGERTIQELIRLAISESDGTAADVLQRVAGNASGVQAYISSLGISKMKVLWTHKEFGAKWERQYENWVTPIAAVELLSALFQTEGVSKLNSELLIKFMTESNNPPNRLKGMLPKGTVVAHKTGSGGTQNGITSATNDVGIITLPNGNQIAIAVFVGDSKAELATREAVIAKTAKAVFEKWSAAKHSEPVKVANFTDRHTLN